MLTGNTTSLAGLSGITSLASNEPFFFVQCGDGTLRSEAVEQTIPYIEALQKSSRLAGESVGFRIMACEQWRSGAREKYAGRFDAKTTRPIVAVGNTWDLATALVNARNVSGGFEGGVLVRHNGHGVRSTCFLAPVPSRVTD